MKMNFLNKFPIRYKLIAITMIVTLATVIIGFTIVYINDAKRLKQNLLEKTLINTKLIANYSVQPLMFNDKNGGEEIMSRLSAIPSVIAGAIFDESDDLFAQYNPEVLQLDQLIPVHKSEYKFNSRVLEVFEPIRYNNYFLGTIYIKTSTEDVLSNMKQYLKSLLILSIGMLILAYILASGFQQIISKPILELASITKEITAKADYSIRIEKKGDDEIGILYEHFNNMLQQIQYREFARDKAENKLKKAKEDAEIADKLKTAFLANMSHEIRTPMNSIIGFSNLLAEENISDKTRKEYIDLINTSSNQLLNLIDDIIDISKIEAGQLSLNKSACDINSIMSELFATYKTEIKRLGKEKNLEIKYIKPDFPDEALIYTDPYRFRQVMENFLSNALKFTEKGTIEFGYLENSPRTLKFYVKDTGIGLPKNIQRTIFERFIKYDDDKTKLFRGAGLGLAISKSLVNLLGGKIWVESIEGEGSTFFFTLPNEKIEKEPKKTETVVGDSNVIIWNNKTILIAEDEDINYKYLEELLKKTGIEILRAKDGAEVVEKTGQHQIDVILMDIKMPVMNGYDATKLIKKTHQIPIIAQTAYAMAGEKEKSLDAGCDDYLSKPIQKSQLLKVLGKYLNK